MPASPTPVMEQLRDATRDLHAQLEALPFVATLFEGRLPLESYVGQLRALAILHGVLEHALMGLTQPAIKAVWEEEMKRLPLLENDLAYFQPRSQGDLPEATTAALTLAEHVTLRSVQDPLTLLGYVYVLEGSTQGAAVLRPRVAETFQLDGSEGLSYLLNYGDQAGTGILLAAAVADERAGVENAVESLEIWLTDAARFPPAWIQAVRAVIQEARETTRSP